MLGLIEKSVGYITLIAFVYLLKKRGIFTKADKDVLGKLLMYIMLPCAFVANFESFQKNYLMIYFFLIGLGINFIMISVGYLCSRKRSGDVKAMYMIESSGYNIGAFTTPFISSFLPTETIVIASIFDIGNCIMAIGGVYPLARGIVEKKQESRIGVIKNFFLKLVGSVPFDTYVVMLIISLLGFHLPAAVNNIAKTIGSPSIIVTMIMIGIAFETNVSKEDVVDIFKILFIRYFIGIMAGVIIWNFFDFSYLAKKVLILCMLAPVTSISPMFCNLCNCKDSVYGAVSSLTVPISLVAFIIVIQFLQI